MTAAAVGFQILVCWILDHREEETETCLILTAVGAETARPQTKT